MKNLAHIGEHLLDVRYYFGNNRIKMVNTEGSRNLSQELKIRKHIVKSLSHRQVEILVGSLLGDGYIHPLGKMCFEQAENQYGYLLWKYSELKNFAYPKIAKVSRFDKRSGKYTHSYRFFLKQYFQSWRQIWYPEGAKRIPNNIEGWFTPLSLAVWYMDDGHYDKGKSALFSSENFCQADLRKMQDILSKWNLETSLSKSNRLRVLHSSISHFIKLTSPYIMSDMRYKILDPVTT